MGNDEAVAAWRAYYPRLTVYVRQAFPALATEAADLVQESFARSWSAETRFDTAKPRGPWLYAIARRVCLDRLRRAGRRPVEVSGVDLETPADPRRDPPAELQRAETRALVAAAVGALPPSDREICFLYYYEELAVAEIGRIVGKPAGTVKFRLFALRRVLRRRLEAADAVPYG